MNPKLRWPLDLRIEKLDDQEALIIRCPFGITKQPLVLMAAVAPIVSCLEGHMSVDDIVGKFAQYGATKEIIEKIINTLDENLLLEGTKFRVAEAEMKENFLKAAVRPAALAGLSYPGEPALLEAQLDHYLSNASGLRERPNDKMITLVSPHIDYRRGGIAYGVTYSHLRQEAHDLYIVIGTAHQASRGMFYLSNKHFATPLGELPCDLEFVEELAKLYGHDRSFIDQFLHKQEHSLELQLPFMQRVGVKAKIVPILVGSFYHMLRTQKAPQGFDEYESFVGALSEAMQKRINSGARVCIVAGVDMAHIGRAFGDKGQLTPEFMSTIEARDRIYLDSIKEQNKHKLFMHIVEDMDARRICGFPTMYTVIDTFDRLNIRYKAELFDYRQAVDYKTDCAVTFAGMGLYS